MGEWRKNMNKIVKSIISIMMSLAMIVCIIPTEAMATEISEQDYGISVQRFTIGKKYTKKELQFLLIILMLEEFKNL